MFRKAARPSERDTNVTISDSAPCQKTLQVQVSPQTIEPVRAAVLAERQRATALPGFRKGKAPPELVARQYAKEIQEETLHRLTQQTLERVTKEHGLKPVGPFELSRATFTEREGLLLEAAVEVEPAFPLASYKGIALKRVLVEVTPQDVEQALASLQESMTQLVPTGQGEAKAPQRPPIDDELAKDLGFENLAKLRSHVEAKVREQRRAAAGQALEAALCDELLKRHPFEVPPRLVQHQTERLLRDFKARLLLSGLSEEQVNARAAQFDAQLRTSAERHVKLSFILDRIAEAESLAVKQEELVGRLWQLAQRWKKDPAEVRTLLDAQGLWGSVVSAIRQEKTVQLLLSSAAIKNGTT
jgi:FKBP-type peptidyl-prolyl cis-trans isomerase (trigger factor)